MAREHESKVEERREEERKEHRAMGGKSHMTHGGHREVSDGQFETMGEMPEPPHEARGGRAEHHKPGHEHDKHHPDMHHKRRRRGGSSEEDGEPEGGGKLQVYNAKDSKAVEDAEDEKPEFKKGGRKRKAGGHAEGHMEHKRLDRRPRRAAGGKAADHSPYSSAAMAVAPAEDVVGRGYEGKEKRT